MGSGTLERITPRIRAAFCCVVCTCVAGCGSAAQPPSHPAPAGSGSAPTIHTTASATAPASGLVDTYHGQLKSANAALGAPKKLQVGQGGTVDLRVSRNIPISSLRSELSKAGTKIGVHVYVSDQMTAHLIGDAFKISMISAPTQAVGPDVTDWQWQVTPTAPGAQQLHASLTAYVLSGGTRVPYGVRTFNRTLDIEAVAVPITTRVTNFLSANWVWIAGIAGAFGVVFGKFATWRRRRANRASSGLTL